MKRRPVMHDTTTVYDFVAVKRFTFYSIRISIPKFRKKKSVKKIEYQLYRDFFSSSSIDRKIFSNFNELFIEAIKSDH